MPAYLHISLSHKKWKLKIWNLPACGQQSQDSCIAYSIAAEWLLCLMVSQTWPTSSSAAWRFVSALSSMMWLSCKVIVLWWTISYVRSFHMRDIWWLLQAASMLQHGGGTMWCTYILLHAQAGHLEVSTYSISAVACWPFHPTIRIVQLRSVTNCVVTCQKMKDLCIERASIWEQWHFHEVRQAEKGKRVWSFIADNDRGNEHKHWNHLQRILGGHPWWYKHVMCTRSESDVCYVTFHLRCTIYTWLPRLWMAHQVRHIFKTHKFSTYIDITTIHASKLKFSEVQLLKLVQKW